jgi:isopenicillin N synthase-like dioxygenase
MKEAWDSWGLEMIKDSSYPSEVPGFKPAIEEFRDSLVILAKKIFLAFSIHMKLDDPEYLLKKHLAMEELTVKSHNDVRSNYYMPLPDYQINDIQDDSMRLNEHNDWGTVTFLVQDHIGGLEAKKTTGEWVPVPPIKDSIVLNAGLMLEMWSGGNFPATVI